MFHARRLLRFGDCDPSGIAYFPSYLDMLVGVTEDFFASVGFPWHILTGERRIGLPTVRLDLRFSRPGMQGTDLHFHLRVRRVGNTSLDLDHEVGDGGAVLWTARQVLVATSLDTHKAISWPDDLRRALTQAQEANDAHDPAT